VKVYFQEEKSVCTNTVRTSGGSLDPPQSGDESNTLAEGVRAIAPSRRTAKFRVSCLEAIPLHETRLWNVMRNLNAEPTSSDVYLWSPAPHSIDRAFHKIWGWVKRSGPDRNILRKGARRKES
jgi:hypothetical protein